MDSSNESDKPLAIHPEDKDGSRRRSCSGNSSIEDVEQVGTSTEELPLALQPHSERSVCIASRSPSNMLTEEDLRGRKDAARKSAEKSVTIASTSSSNMSTEEDLQGREDAARKSIEKSVTIASTSSSNISTEEDLQGREDAARKSTEDITLVRINEGNPFNAVRMDENILSCPEGNGKNQPALGEIDDDAASIVSDRSSFLVPASPLSDFTANLTPYCLSPMQSPPLQAMDRSGAPRHFRIPSAVFAMSSSPPIEWSLASNESLFSLHVGNNSFTKDRVVVLNSDTPKSCEQRKSIEVVSTSEGLPSDDSIANMEKIFQENIKPIDILEDLSKGCEKEPGKGPSLAVTWKSTSYPEFASAPSFSIPVKKRRSSKSGTQWIREIFCCHMMTCASPSCGCCSNCSSTYSCCDSCSGKRLCSIILCGLPEVTKCCNSRKTQHAKASSKSDTDDCFSCSCSSFHSCCICPSCSSRSSCCSCPSCHSCCSCSSFSCSSCHSCCSCWSCNFPSSKSCCYCPSCSSCCTFPSCRSCCSFPSCRCCKSC